MRIISGKLKGKRLTAPKKLPVRPTTDMAKEGLFNILNNRYYFEHIDVLDLFSGTGNISFEFASRNSRSVKAVDAHASCIAYISKTAKTLDLDIATVKADVFMFLSKAQGKFDVIFADPPYDFSEEQLSSIVNLVFTGDFLSKEGVLILEHASHKSLAELPYFQEKRKYGSSIFSFFSVS